MKLQIFLLFFSLAFAFFISSFSVISQANPVVSCDNCIANTQCSCQVTGCSIGLARIYSNNICSDIADSVFKFNNNIFSWLPQKAGDFYSQASCDDGQVSTCSKISVNQELFSCILCNTGTCFCGFQGCQNGIVDFYSSLDCSSVPYQSKVFSGSTLSFSINKNVAIKISCNDGSSSACMIMNYNPTSTTTTTITTTPISKTQCPYPCCINEKSYFDKDCANEYICTNHSCYFTTASTTDIPHSINYSLYIAIFLAIFFVISLVYFVFIMVIGKRSVRWHAKKP